MDVFEIIWLDILPDQELRKRNVNKMSDAKTVELNLDICQYSYQVLNVCKYQTASSVAPVYLQSVGR